ncbi:MAG TPA: SCO family protein [Candidatus Limnocylindrales bacterium]|nr:SCO family protein [Candidatus Limnocylindrales bacterium]
MVSTPAAIVAQAPAPPAPRAFVPELHEGDAVPDVPLIDQRGRAFSFQRTGGRVTVLSFIYTRCADARMCPLVSAKFAKLQRALRGEPVRLVLVTLDPAYDTPRVLARYGARYGADPDRWALATGEPATVEEVAERFGIAVSRPLPGVVAHTEAVIVIDANARVARIVDGAAWLPDDLAASARDVAGLGGDPVRRAWAWLAESASAICGTRGSPPVTPGEALAILAAAVVVLGLAAHRAFRTHAGTPPIDRHTVPAHRPDAESHY